MPKHDPQYLEVEGPSFDLRVRGEGASISLTVTRGKDVASVITFPTSRAPEVAQAILEVAGLWRA